MKSIVPSCPCGLQQLVGELELTIDWFIQFCGGEDAHEGGVQSQAKYDVRLEQENLHLKQQQTIPQGDFETQTGMILYPDWFEHVSVLV